MKVIILIVDQSILKILNVNLQVLFSIKLIGVPKSLFIIRSEILDLNFTSSTQIEKKNTVTSCNYDCTTYCVERKFAAVLLAALIGSLQYAICFEL